MLNVRWTGQSTAQFFKDCCVVHLILMPSGALIMNAISDIVFNFSKS
jgi:hypothetical protein